jgi:Protein of unknown function (DUF2934)
MLETASTKPQRERDLSPANTSDAHQRPASRMSKIARRAHEIYEARGGEHGKALEDWLQAEREIDSELSAVPGVDR